MRKLTYEEFLEYTWDYVSHEVVSDDMWENNSDYFHQITVDLYDVYRKGLRTDEGGCLVARLSPKECAKYIEIIFSNMNRLGFVI